MKYRNLAITLLLILSASLINGATGQQRSQKHNWELKNSFALKGSIYWASGEGHGYLPLSLEYDRIINDKLSWGAVLQYMKMDLVLHDIALNQNSLLLGCKINRNIRIVNKLYFRIGVGVGFRYDYNVRYRSILYGDFGRMMRWDDNVSFQILLDLQWLLSISRRVDIMFSPIPYFPSWFTFAIFSPYVRGNKLPAIMFDLGAMVAVRVRF